MRILGIDPGSVNTGYGVVDQIKGKLTLVEQGSIRCPKTNQIADRLTVIYEGLVQLISRCRPDVGAIETPFAGRNVKSLIQLAHARGVAMLAVRNAGLEIFEYSPSTIKSAVVGYGGADKEQIAKMVQILLPEIGKLKITADASDALAVAVCHAHSAKMMGIARAALR